MRISDWSSDVCSSDLEAFLLKSAPFGAAGVHGLDDVVIGAGHAVIQPQQVAHRVVLRHDEPESAGRQPGKIGRASCRERVWQYVSISVVAGSLKKNNKKQNVTPFDKH